jgi:hypothetical protein
MRNYPAAPTVEMPSGESVHYGSTSVQSGLQRKENENLLASHFLRFFPPLPSRRRGSSPPHFDAGLQAGGIGVPTVVVPRDTLVLYEPICNRAPAEGSPKKPNPWGLDNNYQEWDDETHDSSGWNDVIPI